MRCPECVESGRVSHVFDLGGSVTCMGHTPYYDERGEYHNHDPNWRDNSYRCSLGHQWSVSSRRRCTAPGCEFGSEKPRVTRHEPTAPSESRYVFAGPITSGSISGTLSGSVRVAPSPAPELAERAQDEINRTDVLNDIAVMMSEFVDNWPNPKKVSTALALVAKTFRTLLDPPKHRFWGAGEPDCPADIKAPNGELWKRRCKVCGSDNPRDDRCLPPTPAPEHDLQNPAPAPTVRGARLALVEGVISMYHTTRLSGGSAAEHVLSKDLVQRLFADLAEAETHEREAVSDARHSSSWIGD